MQFVTPIEKTFKVSVDLNDHEGKDIASEFAKWAVVREAHNHLVKCKEISDLTFATEAPVIIENGDLIEASIGVSYKVPLSLAEYIEHCTGIDPIGMFKKR